MTSTYDVSTVQFETKQGTLVQFTVDDICRGNQTSYACDGKTIQIFYHPDDPEIHMIKGGSTPMNRVSTWIVWGLVFVLGGVGSSWLFRQKGYFRWD